ncbi:hypothetical protein JCM10450v2_004303 [Rhodotorula kratochvilovae]
MVDATTACARYRTGDRKDAKPDKMKMAGLYGGGNPGSNSKDECAPYMWAVGGGAARKEEELRIRLRGNPVTLPGKDEHDEVRRRAALAKTKKGLTHRPVDQPAASNSLGLCGLDEEDGSSCDLLAPFVEDKPITTAAGRNKEAASDALQYWPEPCGGNAEWAPVKVAPVEDKPFLSPSIPQADSTGDASAHSDIKPWIPSTAAADVLFRNYNRSPSIPLPASSAVLTPPPSPPKATVKLEADDYITCKQEPSSRPAFPTPSASHLPDAAIFTPLLSPVGEALAAAPAAAPLSPPLVDDGAAAEEDWSRILAGPFARSRAPSVESRPASPPPSQQVQTDSGMFTFVSDEGYAAYWARRDETQ